MASLVKCRLEKTYMDASAVNYLLYLPKRYKFKNNWPVILFLHGVGERGNDLDKVKRHGPPKLIETGHNLPFIVIAPQCRLRNVWSNATLISILDEVESSYNVDPARIYLTGLSMGGWGTWSLAIEFPERFAAIAPVCGGGNPVLVDRLKSVPVWVFHGDQDEVVPIKRSIEMVSALKEAGGNVKFTIYPGVEHDSWTETYTNPELYDWFLKYER